MLPARFLSQFQIPTTQPHQPLLTMVSSRSFISTPVIDFYHERLLKQHSLHRLKADDPRNFRCSPKAQAGPLTLEKPPTEKEEQDPITKTMMERPLYLLPLPDTRLHADKQPGLGIILSPDTSIQSGSEEVEHPTVPVQHVDDQDGAADQDVQTTVTSIAQDDDVKDSKTEDSHEPRTDLSIPARAVNKVNKVNKSEVIVHQGQTILVFNAKLLARLTRVLQAGRNYRDAQRNAKLEEHALDTFTAKLTQEIAMYERGLARQRYNVGKDRVSDPRVNVPIIQDKLKTLGDALSEVQTRHAGRVAALEQRGRDLDAAQARVIAVFEKVFARAEMLRDENCEPSFVPASYFIGKYKAFCGDWDIAWDDDEAW